MLAKSILNITSAYQFYQLARTSTMILISIILVKSGFSKSEVSSFELFLFIANLLSFFWVMGVKNAALSYYHRMSSKEQKTFFTTVFVLLQMAGLIFSFVLLIVFPFKLIDDDLLLSQSISGLLLLYIFFYAPTVLIEIIFILREEHKKLLEYAIFIHLIPLIAFFLLAISYNNILLLFAVLAGWVILKWIYLIYLLITSTQFKIERKTLKAFIIFSAPIIMHILLGNGMEFIDGIFVNQFFEQEQFAVYRYGARELPFVIILISALSSTQIPLAVKNLKTSAANIRSRTQHLMHIFFPLSIILMFLSPFLFESFYSDAFRISSLYFNIYLLILVSRILLSEVFIYATGQNKLLMYVSGAELVLNIVLSLVLMQYIGLAGIAYATVAAFLVSKVFLAFHIWKKKGIRPSDYLNINWYILYSVGLYVAFILSIFLVI